MLFCHHIKEMPLNAQGLVVRLFSKCKLILLFFLQTMLNQNSCNNKVCHNEPCTWNLKRYNFVSAIQKKRTELIKMCGIKPLVYWYANVHAVFILYIHNIDMHNIYKYMCICIYMCMGVFGGGKGLLVGNFHIFP